MKLKQTLSLVALFAAFAVQAEAAPGLNTVPEPLSLALLALGFLAMALVQRNKPLLSLPWDKPSAMKKNTISRFSTAKLLRRDVRNNLLVFRFIRQRKHNLL